MPGPAITPYYSWWITRLVCTPGVRDIDTLQLKHNVVGLTRAMLALKVPVVVTTTVENMVGPLIPELADVLHGVPTIERTTVNAWHEKRVVDAAL